MQLVSSFSRGALPSACAVYMTKYVLKLKHNRCQDYVFLQSRECSVVVWLRGLRKVARLMAAVQSTLTSETRVCIMKGSGH